MKIAVIDVHNFLQHIAMGARIGGGRIGSCPIYAPPLEKNSEGTFFLLMGIFSPCGEFFFL